MHARAEKPVEALQQGHVAVAHLHAIREALSMQLLQQGHVAVAHLHARQPVATARNPSQSVAIRRNQSWPQGQWPLRTGKRRKGPKGGR